MTRVAIYARVSTSEQRLETQLLPLRELAAQKGYTVVAVFCDQISGTKARRPGLNALLADAHRRKFSVVLVAGFDRIARSVRHFLQIIDELESLGISFVSAREQVDTTGPMGRMFLTIIGSVAELEGALIRERVRQGMRRRKLEGFRLGRQPLNIDREALIRDRAAGVSLSACAERYGISRPSVVRIFAEAKKQNNQASVSVASTSAGLS